MGYRVLTINPGSTSTKIALFDGEEKLFSYTVEYEARELERFRTISDQLPYRLKNIDQVLSEHGIELGHLDACVGRGGSLHSMEGGTYEVDSLLLEHATVGINGVYHPAQLGTQIAHVFGQRFHCPVYTVNPPEVDEFTPVARMTGLKGIKRESHLHALNLKETAIRHARLMGKRYEECSFIVCHIGGGISVSAHRKGRMIDGNDIAKGLGPIAPTRCGSVPLGYFIEKYVEAGIPKGELLKLCTKNGGVMDLLGTSDMREVWERKNAGDDEAGLVWSAVVYTICKEIGSMAAVLKGDIDGILLGGGLVHNENLVEQIREACGFLADITAYPGEFEMEAMAAGACRVLSGEEPVKKYTGIPVYE